MLCCAFLIQSALAPLLQVYMSELALPRSRGRLIGMYQLAVVLGGLYGVGMNSMLLRCPPGFKDSVLCDGKWNRVCLAWMASNGLTAELQQLSQSA